MSEALDKLAKELSHGLKDFGRGPKIAAAIDALVKERVQEVVNGGHNLDKYFFDTIELRKRAAQRYEEGLRINREVNKP